MVSARKKYFLHTEAGATSISQSGLGFSPFAESLSAATGNAGIAHDRRLGGEGGRLQHSGSERDFADANQSLDATAPCLQKRFWHPSH
jgi:hypothetical protein